METFYLATFALKCHYSDVPGPPQNIRVSDIFSTNCTLSWTEPEDDGGSPITQYLLEYKNLDKKEKWTSLGQVSADVKSFKAENLVEKSKYRFRLRAVNKVGPSEPAELADTVIPRDPWNFPGPPQDLEITNWDKDFVDLAWKPPLKDGGAPILNYVVECKEKFSKEWIKCGASNSCETKVEDVIREGKTYEFRVKAVNKAGEGEPSVPTKAVTIKSRFVKPFIVGEGMKDIVIKRGQNLSWDITYAGEPEPEVCWMFGETKIIPDGDR